MNKDEGYQGYQWQTRGSNDKNDASCSASEVTKCQRAQGAPRLEVACPPVSLGSGSMGGDKVLPHIG